MVDEIFFSGVSADVPFQRELTRDDFLDRDLFFPAIAAILFFAARLRDFLGAAQRASRLHEGLAWHSSIYNLQWTMSKERPMERPRHAGLRHLALNVRDLAAMKRFYT